MGMTSRRWDIDTAGEGIGDARESIPAVQRLLSAMGEPRWVAEQPEAHLLPHISAECEREGSPWRLIEISSDGARLVVTLEWRQDANPPRNLTMDSFALLGRMAESNTHVREEKVDGVTEFQVTTGMLDGDSEFRGHGHTLRFRIMRP